MTSPPSSPPLMPYVPPTPPPPPGPPQPGPVARLRPEPPSAAAPGRLLAAAGLAGLLAASVLVDVRPGVGVPLVGLAVAGAVAVGGSAVGGSATGRGRRLLLAVCLALTAVAAVRDSAWLVWLCLLAAVVLAPVAVTGARGWAATAVAPLLGVVAFASAVGWARRGLPRARPTAASRAWLRGLAVGAVAAVVVGALLASADAAFADLLATLSPSFDVGSVPGRVALLALVAPAVLGGVVLQAHRPDWSQLHRSAGPDAPGGTARPAAEWAVPLALVDAVLAAFVVLQGDLLGAAPATPDGALADRARQGFGQLVAVTLLTTALLVWCVRRAHPRRSSHRLVVAVLGGGMVALTLAVVASALGRLWRYEQAYGWTVLRLLVGLGELWLGAVLLLVAALWTARRLHLVAPLVVGSAAACLAAVALAGPDALVARANVDRFAESGRVDVRYLQRLSADAVPELDRLPEPLRSCVLDAWAGAGTVDPDPWSGANLARARARQVLAERPPARLPAGCGVAYVNRR